VQDTPDSRNRNPHLRGIDKPTVKSALSLSLQRCRAAAPNDLAVSPIRGIDTVERDRLRSYNG